MTGQPATGGAATHEEADAPAAPSDALSAYCVNLTDRARQGLLDPLIGRTPELQRTIDDAWSRRHRWERFRRIAELVTTHAANSGQAPSIIRRYLDQNIL